MFSSLRVAVFVDGCFWHGCPDHFQQPKTNADFWRQKIGANMDRDVKNTAQLEAMGWVVIRCWEHEIRQDLDACVERVVAILTERQYRSG